PKEVRRSKSQVKQNSSLDFELRTSFDLRISDFGFPTDGLLALSPLPELAPFFPNHFYLEINSLESYSRSIGHFPVVASFSIHYALPSDRWKYDIVHSIRTLTLLRQQHPEKRLYVEYHFRPPAEMQQFFV